MMQWAISDKPHTPTVLTKDGIEEMRHLGLYPNAANLLATVDALLADAEELANALRDVLAGHPVRNADELIARYSPLPAKGESAEGGREMTPDELVALIELDEAERVRREAAFAEWFKRVIAPKFGPDADLTQCNHLRTLARAGFMAGVAWWLDQK